VLRVLIAKNERQILSYSKKTRTKVAIKMASTSALTSMSTSRNTKRQRAPKVADLLRLMPLVCVLLFHQQKTTTTVSNAFCPQAMSTFTTTITADYPHFRSHYHYSHVNILSIPEADSLPDDCKERIADHTRESGIWDNTMNGSSEQLLLLARDFVDRPEVFSSLLISDFGFPAIVAHQTRSLAMAAIRGEQEINNGVVVNNNYNSNNNNSNNNEIVEKARISTVEAVVKNNNTAENKNGGVDMDQAAAEEQQTDDDTAVVVKTYTNNELKSAVVNQRAHRRKRSIEHYNYGLPSDYSTMYPRLAKELDDYYTFMTQPSTYSQESPIRDATAKVYLNHAKLFLGWCCQNTKGNENSDNSYENKNVRDDDQNETESPDRKNPDMSLFVVIPNKNKESANNIIRFVLWLRSRDISVSYEANLLRGIIKLLKFRFAKESESDPLEGQNTFDDIPIIKEVRKLHRDANQRQRLAPRSSDESKKWITWKEYLGVTQNIKNEVLELTESYEKLSPSKRRYGKGDIERIHSLEQIRVAEAYQRYLILAILASVPDRQRTIRELEVGRTLMKDAESNCWVVKHGPADYKTGKHYGERPAMQLAEELTPSIDDFLENWRPALKPSTNVLLVQSKTGKPMTSNSIFKRVVRCCFKYTGKSVNPHLLRDIIVTHVRETDASEKELEALALYMGHSIQMQRSSYDRRTLSTKVAPAIKLMRSVNNVRD